MYDPILTAALASARHEDLRREVDQLQRQRHLEAAVRQPGPARETTMSRRLSRAIPRGLARVLADSRS